jgi:hypothetical protein
MGRHQESRGDKDRLRYRKGERKKGNMKVQREGHEDRK